MGWDRGFHLILTILMLQVFWRWVCQWVLAQITILVIKRPWCFMFILFGQDWLMRLNNFVHFTKCLNGKIMSKDCKLEGRWNLKLTAAPHPFILVSSSPFHSKSCSKCLCSNKHVLGLLVFPNFFFPVISHSSTNLPPHF